MSELTREEIERIKQQEAEEAPSTAKSDRAWNFNDSFTAIKLKYESSEEFLQATADRANLYANDYIERKRDAMHFIATQDLFDFDEPVNEYVIDLVKEIALVNRRKMKAMSAKKLTDLVYPIARQLIPNDIFAAYRNNPDAFKRMEGFHLQDSYVGLSGDTKEYNAWIELDMPNLVSPNDIHDGLKRYSEENYHFAHRLKMAIRNAHRAAGRYRKTYFDVTVKCVALRRMTYGNFANEYPVTFHNICKYIQDYGLEDMVRSENETNIRHE